jgi:ribosomal protein L1
MSKLTKKQKTLVGKVDSLKLYALADALTIVKECATAKFDESIDVAVQLGIDAKKSDQVVRGAVVLPNGTGKTARVAVFAQGAKAEEALAAGADVVGMDDLAARVKAGDMPFDVVIAAPDAMRVVGTLGQILGPRGLMPNPRAAKAFTCAKSLSRRPWVWAFASTHNPSRRDGKNLRGSKERLNVVGCCICKSTAGHPRPLVHTLCA